MRQPTPSFSTLLGLSLLTQLSARINAQLLGCDAVQCPAEAYYDPGCTVGNATSATSIGIATSDDNFLTSDPITWTATLSSTPQQGSDHFERTYFLGLPSALAKDKAVENTCVLVFEGAAEFMKFTNADPEVSNGTCIDAFVTSKCFDTFVAQAKSEVSKLRSSGKNKCEALKNALQSSAPPECADVAPKNSWGVIEAKALEDLRPIKEDGNTCHPTLGPDYELSLAANFQYPIANDTSPGVLQNQLGYIRYGVTPILLVDVGSTAEETEDKEADLHITCIRPMPKTDGLAASESKDDETGAASSGKSMALATVLGVGFVLSVQSLLL